MLKYGLIIFFGLQLGLLLKSFANRQVTDTASVKLTEQPTFDNLSAYVLASESATTKTTPLGALKSPLERNIHAVLKSEPEVFLNSLSPETVGLTLKLNNGIAIILKADSLLTLAAQEIAEEVNNIIPKSKGLQIPPNVLSEVQKILLIEKKRNELASIVSKNSDATNFNPTFEYMIQANFRKPNRLTQGLLWPPRVQALMWGRKNPNQAAFQALKTLTFDVLTADQSSPLTQVRRLKINSTAQMVPFFKPSLNSWEVEAFYFNKRNDRIPTSEQAQK